MMPGMMGGMMPGMMGGGYGQMPFGPLQGAFSSLSDTVSSECRLYLQQVRCSDGVAASEGLNDAQASECPMFRATNSLGTPTRMARSSRLCRSRRRAKSLASESSPPSVQFGELMIHLLVSLAGVS
jgi:hypothetical protein